MLRNLKPRTESEWQTLLKRDDVGGVSFDDPEDWQEYLRRRDAAKRQHWNEMTALSASNPGEYRDAFIAGYLQAYEDTDEYGCSVDQAIFAHGQHLADGKRGEPPEDVKG